MRTKCIDIIEFMEEIAPPCLAEEWDNVGLLLGSSGSMLERVLVCLDVTQEVVEEAVEKKVNLIISHHPFIFKGMKRIVEDDFQGGTVYKLIRNNIGVYSAHTNLDVTDGGINEYLAELLGLKKVKSLSHYKSEDLYKIVVFVPEDSVDSVRKAMCDSGAGWIGNYSECTFMTKGTGTFKPLEGTNPYIGTKGRLEMVEEYRLETIVPKSRQNRVLSAMLKTHPYEEVAYDVYPLKLQGKEYGLGKVGMLEEAADLRDFISLVKQKLNLNSVRLIGKHTGKIEKVGVFCGSFDGNIGPVLANGVDVLVTGDMKHHIALDMAAIGLCVIDAGHFGTERIMMPKLAQLLSGRFPQLEVLVSEVEEDPIKTY